MSNNRQLQDNDTTDIYCDRRRISLTARLKRLSDDPLVSERNKQLLNVWCSDWQVKGAHPDKTISMRLLHMVTLCQQLKDKNLDRMDKVSLNDLLVYISRLPVGTTTIQNYKRTLKQFYHWFEDEDTRTFSSDREQQVTAMKFYKHLKTVNSADPIKDIDPSLVLTRDDLYKAIELGTRSLRDKGLIGALSEGLRIGECLGCHIRDFEHRGTHGILHVKGKTGRRPVTMTWSLPFLTNWLSVHPLRSNPEAPLFIAEGNFHKFQALKYGAARKVVKTAFVRAGIAKPNNPHWLRHSYASETSGKLSDAIQCEQLGWVQGSKVPRRYRHIKKEQVTNAILASEGIKTADQTAKSETIQCGCGTVNVEGMHYCHRCGRPLSVEVIEAERAMTEKALSQYEQIMSDPAKREQFKQYVLKLELEEQRAKNRS